MNKLTYFSIGTKHKVVFDPDNVFWGIVDGSSIPHRLLSLYQKYKLGLDAELNDFRFAQDLSAIYIDPTDRCNSYCPYCYIPAKLRKNGHSMNSDELTFILKKVAQYFNHREKKPVIVFHAAEPLLVKDIIFEAIKNFRKEFYFGLQTNAILLEKEDIEFFKKYGVGVGISLDSHLASINNNLRPTKDTGGNFAQALKAIEWFAGYSGLNVITTITKFNVVHLPDLVKFLHSKKVPCVLLNPVRLTQKTSHKLKPEQNLLIKYFLKAVEKAIELSKISKRRIIIGNFANIILGIIAPTSRRLMCDISPCGGGRCFLTITAKGRMIPCGEFIGLVGFSGGNIFKTDIKKAMESKSFRKLRARFVEKIEKCNSCTFRNICGAPCPAELYAIGDMYQPSIFCKFYKKIIQYAFKVIAQGKEKYCLRPEGLSNIEYHYNFRDSP